jgi:hypothetical protein
MKYASYARTIGWLLAVIALLLVGVGATMREAAAQPGPGGEPNPYPSPQPGCEVTRPDLIVTAARLGYDSVRQIAYLDVVVQNRNSGCSRAAGTFRVNHRTNDHPTTTQSVYVYGGLAAGASRTVRVTNAPRCGYWETLRGTVTADSLNHVAERNESNNVYNWHQVC